MATITKTLVCVDSADRKAVEVGVTTTNTTRLVLTGQPFTTNTDESASPAPKVKKREHAHLMTS